MGTNYEQNDAEHVVAMAGEHISMVARRAVDVANRTGAPARFTFNEVDAVASPGASPEGVEAEYMRRAEERRVAWEQSPEGQRCKREQEERIVAAQAKVDRAMESLGGLNANDLGAVLAWVEEIAEPAAHVRVVVPRARILDWFKAHGWVPGMNCGAAFKAEDRQNFAGYIIGQALNGFERVGAPHPMLAVFTEQWRQKFCS